MAALRYRRMRLLGPGFAPDAVQPEAKGGLIPLSLGMVILLNSGPRALA